MNCLVFSRPYLVRSHLCYSVASVVCIECIVAKWWILEQKCTIDSLREVIYEKSIGTKMTRKNLCLEIISRLCQPLRYIRRWISWKPLEIEAWFQRTTN